MCRLEGTLQNKFHPWRCMTMLLRGNRTLHVVIIISGGIAVRVMDGLPLLTEASAPPQLVALIEVMDLRKSLSCPP